MDYQAIIESLFRGLIGERFIVFALAAIGLNLHFGYTGLLNFGQAVFMAAGAYGLAMMVATIGPRLNENTGLNMSDTTLFWVGVFMARLCIERRKLARINRLSVPSRESIDRRVGQAQRRPTTGASLRAWWAGVAALLVPPYKNSQPLRESTSVRRANGDYTPNYSKKPRQIQ